MGVSVAHARMHARATVYLCIEETPPWIYVARDIDILIYIGVKEVRSGEGREMGKWGEEQSGERVAREGGVG